MDLQHYLQSVWTRLREKSDVGIECLAGCLSMDLAELAAVRRTYDRIVIPKRTGRPRLLLAPKGELKRVQKLILRRLLDRLPCHAKATGFRKGRSIVTNASLHTRSEVVVGLDLRDFFSSTKAERVLKLFRWLGWDFEAARMLTRLCTYEGGLPQGAPTSPCLSNLVNYRLDCRLDGLADENGAVYSRYADDMAFSFKKRSGVNVYNVVKKSIKITGEYGYDIQENKTRIIGSHHRQLVTGLVVNDTVHLPRERRRLLRAVEHRLKVGGSITLSDDQLQGWRGLARMVDSKP